MSSDEQKTDTEPEDRTSSLSNQLIMLTILNNDDHTPQIARCTENRIVLLPKWRLLAEQRKFQPRETKVEGKTETSIIVAVQILNF